MKHILLKELINEEEQPIYTFDKFNRLHRNGVHIPVNRQTPEEGNMYLNNMRTQDALPYTAGREPPTIPSEQKESISWMDETTETDAAETMDIIHADDAEKDAKLSHQISHAGAPVGISHADIYGVYSSDDNGQAKEWDDQFKAGTGLTVRAAEHRAKEMETIARTAAERQRLIAADDAREEDAQRGAGVPIVPGGTRTGHEPPKERFIGNIGKERAEKTAHTQHADDAYTAYWSGVDTSRGIEGPKPPSSTTSTGVDETWPLEPPNVRNLRTGVIEQTTKESIGWIAEGDMGFQPGEEVHMCPGCKYPSRSSSCDNPGCFDNPTISPETKAKWKAQMEIDAAAQTERDMIHRVRKQSIGW